MKENIIVPFEDESYESYIKRILSLRGNEKDENNYQERHHIVPKCNGGSNDDSNLIYLYAQEHYYAHKILANQYPENDKFQFAWWNLSHCRGSSKKRLYEVSPEDYEEAKKRHSKLISGKNNHNYGGMSEESKKKMSLHHCDVSNGNNPRSKPVKCLETGEEFSCAAEAGKHYNLAKSNPGSEIRKSCKTGCSAGYNKKINKFLHWTLI